MGTSRKQALKKIEGIWGAIRTHLDKLRMARDPDLFDFHRKELENMLDTVRRYARSVGRKTELEVMARVIEVEKEKITIEAAKSR